MELQDFYFSSLTLAELKDHLANDWIANFYHAYDLNIERGLETSLYCKSSSLVQDALIWVKRLEC
jgi:hypothetical protein